MRVRVSGGVCGGSERCDALLIDCCADSIAKHGTIAGTEHVTDHNSTYDITDAHAN